MKKHGFTLVELLIVLGIIGIVSAITIPMISNLMPDSNKLKVLKAYKTITDMNNEFLNDPGLYFSDGGDCVGIGCTQAPSSVTGEKYGLRIINGRIVGRNNDSDKYRNLIWARLGDITPIATNGNAAATLADGSTWYINPTEDEDGNISGYSINIDVNGPDKGVNESFALGVSKPDTFKFNIDLNGRVTGDDALTIAYLANPSKLNDKKKDRETAWKNFKASTVKDSESKFSGVVSGKATEKFYNSN